VLVCYRDDSGKEPKFGSGPGSFFLAACARRRSAQDARRLLTPSSRMVAERHRRAGGLLGLRYPAN
jgi:hypothetical protein